MNKNKKPDNQTIIRNLARNKLARSADDVIVDIVVWLCTIFVLVIISYPLIYIISSSFSEPEMVSTGKIWLLPKGFNLEGYQKIFEYKLIWTGYRNTIFYTTAGTMLNVTITIMAAYALSRKDLPGRYCITLILVSTMFFNGGIIPTYLVYKKLHLTDTFGAMIITGAITMYNTIVCRTYFSSSIPNEMQEAARIDGCNDIQIFSRIMVPLSKPIIAVIGLFYAVRHWNSYFSALMYLTDIDKYPLQLFLRNILILGQMNDLTGLDSESIKEQMRLMELRESMKYGIIVVSSLPMLALYPFLQKYFVKGVMIGSVKG